MLATVGLIIASYALSAHAASSGVTTRYWDCCKTSCAWNGKATVTHAVTTCDKSNNPLTDANAVSGCDGGVAYACADNSPKVISDTLAYGFAAVNLSGETEADWCCSCYKLTFTSTSLASSGKIMIVQASNTGGDVGGAQFDLMIPGGGVGAFPAGCTNQYGSLSGWGAQYGGVSSVDQCSNLPSALQAGCQFRFGWFEGADNPNVSWEKVTCPASLAAVSGCVRTSEGTVSDSSAASTTKTTTTTTTTKSTTTTTTTTKMVTSTVKPTTTTTTTTTTKVPTTTTTTTKVPTTTTTKAATTTTTTKAATTTTTTTKAATTTTKATTTSSSSSTCNTSTDVALHWGQCGGQNWVGPTTCESPYTCQYQNPWYSQCL